MGLPNHPKTVLQLLQLLQNLLCILQLKITQAKAGAADGGSSEATDAGDDVVDADFEEVKEDK